MHNKQDKQDKLNDHSNSKSKGWHRENDLSSEYRKNKKLTGREGELKKRVNIEVETVFNHEIEWKVIEQIILF